MNIHEALDLLEKEKEGAHKSAKSRVRTFDTIKKALSTTKPGDMFTTDGADRIYVTSKGKWGEKSGRGKIAKGFTHGSATPSANFNSIKKHAARTRLRHGKGSRELAKKFGSRSMKKERGIKPSEK